MKKEELSGYELMCKESIMDEICENVTEGHLRNTLLKNELEKNIITEDLYNMEQEEIIERQEKINELKEYMNHYEEINEKDEIIKDLGDGEIINEHVWDCYDCGMGYSELIGECVYLRKSINKIKKLVKEIC